MDKFIAIAGVLIMTLLLFGCTSTTKTTIQTDLNNQVKSLTLDLNNLQIDYNHLKVERDQLLSLAAKDQIIGSLQTQINSLNLQIIQKTADLNILQANFNVQLMQSAFDLNILQFKYNQLLMDYNNSKIDINKRLIDSNTFRKYYDDIFTTGIVDRNYLSQLIYIGGICERQGFVTTIRTTYNTDLNRYEGLPVCINR
jgi:outer membrane murein-binding lipoprotein Lpp